jgi:hypothetical protein
MMVSWPSAFAALTRSSIDAADATPVDASTAKAEIGIMRMHASFISYLP